MTICRECDLLLWRKVEMCRRCGALRPDLHVAGRVHPGRHIGWRLAAASILVASATVTLLLVDRAALWLLTRGG